MYTDWERKLVQMKILFFEIFSISTELHVCDPLRIESYSHVKFTKLSPLKLVRSLLTLSAGSLTIMLTSVSSGDQII